MDSPILRLISDLYTQIEVLNDENSKLRFKLDAMTTGGDSDD